MKPAMFIAAAVAILALPFLSGLDAATNVCAKPAGTALHVVSVTVVGGPINSSGQSRETWAEVVVADEEGNLVGDATVKGTFSGVYSVKGATGSGASGDTSIVVDGRTVRCDKNPTTVVLTFTVTSVSHAVMSYDPSADLASSGSATVVWNCALTHCKGNQNCGYWKYLPDGTPDPTQQPFAVSRSGTPSPFADHTEIQYTIPEQGHLRVRVVDLSGADVVTLVDTDHPAGDHASLWNGTDGEGREVASGVYVFVVDWNGMRQVVRVVVSR